MRISTSQIFQRGISTMLNQQVEVAQLQQQMATGKRISKPSDDPIGTVSILNLRKEIQSLEQYQLNSNTAKNNLLAEDTALKNVIINLQRVRELLIQGGSDILTQENRTAIATELRQRHAELIGLANSRNTEGEYMFAGFQTQTQPFVVNADDSVSYIGDLGQRRIQLSASISVAMSDSGFEPFAAVPTGNGTFTTFQDPSNTGTGVISLGSIQNASTYVEDTYTIEFVGQNTQGQPAFSVVGATSGQVLPAPPGVVPNDAPGFTEKGAILFNGVEVDISGTPHVGDRFTIAPSQKDNVFDTINTAITALELPQNNDAEAAAFRNIMNQTFAHLDQTLTAVQGVQSQVGARLNTIDNAEQFNQQSLINAKSFLSDIEDADFAETASLLSQQAFSLQAAQQSFARIQGLSLFNFLGG